MSDKDFDDTEKVHKAFTQVLDIIGCLKDDEAQARVLRAAAILCGIELVEQ